MDTGGKSCFNQFRRRLDGEIHLRENSVLKAFSQAALCQEALSRAPRVFIFKDVRHVITAVELFYCVHVTERGKKVRVTHKHDLGLKHTFPTT